MQGKRLFYNTMILTATSLIMRSAGLLFQIVVSKKMGAEGTGLFGLIMSVYSFAATVAISGIRFTTTRLVSEELGKGAGGSVKKLVKRCINYASVTGCAAGIILCLGAEFIGVKLVGDGRTVLSLRILAVSLPFVALGAVYTGYFTGVSRTLKSAISTLSEQAFKIPVSILALTFAPKNDIEGMCAAVVLGNAAGEILSFVTGFVLYRADIRSLQGAKKDKDSGIARIAAMAVPLGLSAYARTALNTVQNVLVPRGLKASGASYKKALSDYGTIQGMVLPVVTFPSVLFSSLSELIVPELTEEQVRGRTDRITTAANMLLKACILFSVGVTGGLLCFSGQLGTAIYNDDTVGHFIRVLAFLMPVMYMDTVTDGMLRGLGEQMYAMGLNIIDSLCCVGLVYFLLPKYALYGYVAILYLSEIVNFTFSLKRLRQKAGVSGLMPHVLKSLLCALGACNCGELFIKLVPMGQGKGALILGIAFYGAVYSALIACLYRKQLKRLLGGIVPERKICKWG